MITVASTGTTEHGPMDPDALTRLKRFGGAKLLHDMIALYVESAAARLVAAEAALASGDPIGTESALHSLKSSSAQLGAARLAQLCGEGETIARGGSLTGLAALLAASREELGRVERWLEGVRAGNLS